MNPNDLPFGDLEYHKCSFKKCPVIVFFLLLGLPFSYRVDGCLLADWACWWRSLRLAGGPAVVARVELQGKGRKPCYLCAAFHLKIPMTRQGIRPRLTYWPWRGPGRWNTRAKRSFEFSKSHCEWIKSSRHWLISWVQAFCYQDSIDRIAIDLL